MNSKANDPSLHPGSAPLAHDVLHHVPPPSYEQATIYPPQPPYQAGPSSIGFQYPPQPIPPQTIRPYPTQPYSMPIHQHPAVHPPIMQHVIARTVVGPDPVIVTCPACRKQVTSRIELETTTKTHLAALLCVIFGCLLCSCCPYFMESCRDTHHYCPNCGAFIGAYKR